MSKVPVLPVGLELPVFQELDASLSTSALGMEALMDLMASAPAEHRVRTVALRALMLTVSDQLVQASQALRLAQAADGG